MGWLADAVDIVSGIVGDSNADRARAEAKKLNQKNTRLQREFAQNSIQWRVEDAKKAGLHPLFALSGQGASFSPSGIMVDGGGAGFEQMGHGLRNIANRLQNSEEKQLATAQLDVLRAQATKDLAIAAYYDNERGRGVANNQLSSPAPGIWVREDDQGNRITNEPAPDMGKFADFTKVVPSQVQSPDSRDIGIASGADTLWKRYTHRAGMEVILPWSNEGPSESLSEMGPLTAWATWKKNEAAFGAEHAKRVMHEVLGVPMFILNAFENNPDRMRNALRRWGGLPPVQRQKMR